MFEKSFFRKECLRKRYDMDLRSETEKISAYLRSFFKQNHYDSVGLYYPIKNEIDIRTVLLELQSEGAIKTLALPRILNNKMTFAPWRFGQCLSPDQYGIPAPLTSELVYPQCLLIPCVAIDLDVYRLGYGRGWYDRILSGQHFDLTIGVVPACFVCRALAHETYDRALSGWVCENGFTWVVKPSCG